jgi:heme-degrading monooxygenase HmoA
MFYTLVKITVADYAQWRAGYDSLTGLRQSSGAQHDLVFQSADNPNEVFALIGWTDADQARAYFASPELRQGMQRAGVQGPPTIFYLNEMG